jgi:hypothetical protein
VVNNETSRSYYDKEYNSSKFERAFLWLAIGISIIIICFYYRPGGIKDLDYIGSPLRDVEVYIDAGKAILSGNNPYDTIGNRFGFVGCIPFALIANLLPESVLNLTFQLLNILGLITFILIFNKLYTNFRPELLIITSLWLSSFRETLATNQITGILLGLLSTGYYFSLVNKYQASKLKIIVAAFCFVIAIDLKPHLSLIFFIILVVKSRNFQLFKFVTIVWVILHGLVNLSQRRILEFSWLDIVLDLQNQAENTSLGDSVSFWPLLSAAFNIESFPTLLLFLPMLILIICLIVLSNFLTWQEVFIWSFLIPSFFIYFHHYDFVPAAVLFLILLQSRYFKYLLIPVGFFLIPIEFDSVRNQALVLVIFFLWKYHLKSYISYSNLLISWSSLILIHMFNSQIGTSPKIIQSLVVSQMIFMTIALLGYKSYSQNHVRRIDKDKCLDEKS